MNLFEIILKWADYVYYRYRTRQDPDLEFLYEMLANLSPKIWRSRNELTLLADAIQACVSEDGRIIQGPDGIND